MRREDEDSRKAQRGTNQQEPRSREEKLNENDDWNRTARKTSKDETSVKHEYQHGMTVRGRTKLYEHNERENQKIKKEGLGATDDKPKQPRQHKSTQTAENGIPVVNVPAGSPEPANSIEQAMKEQSPTDVFSSLSCFNKAENADLEKNNHKNMHRGPLESRRRHSNAAIYR